VVLELESWVGAINSSPQKKTSYREMLQRASGLGVKIKICETVTISVVLCGCESYSPILREECTLGLFENRALRGTFGPKREELR